MDNAEAVVAVGVRKLKTMDVPRANLGGSEQQMGGKFHIVFDGTKADADFDLELRAEEKCSLWSLEHRGDWEACRG